MASNTLRFDTLKKRAHAALDEHRGEAVLIALVSASHGESANLATYRETAYSLIEEGHRLIDKWDIRCVGKLIGIFPEIAPRTWQAARLRADYDDHGNWVVQAA